MTREVCHNLPTLFMPEQSQIHISISTMVFLVPQSMFMLLVPPGISLLPNINNLCIFLNPHFRFYFFQEDFSDMCFPISTKYIHISILQWWFIYLCLLHYIKSLKQNILSNLSVNLFAQPSNIILIHLMVTPGITLVQDSIFPLAYHNSCLTHTLATSQPGILFIQRSDDVIPFLKILLTAPHFTRGKSSDLQSAL